MSAQLKTQAFSDDDNDRIVIVQSQDVAAIVDDCKARSNEGFHENGVGKHVARVPNVVVEHYLNVHGITLREFMADDTHIRRLVNDPAFADLRIWQGTI